MQYEGLTAEVIDGVGESENDRHVHIRQAVEKIAQVRKERRNKAHISEALLSRAQWIWRCLCVCHIAGQTLCDRRRSRLC